MHLRGREIALSSGINLYCLQQSFSFVTLIKHRELCIFSFTQTHFDSEISYHFSAQAKSYSLCDV